MPSLSDVKIAYKGVALVLLPLLFSVVVLGLLAWLLQQAEIDANREAHARSIQERTNNLGTCFMEAVSTVGSYVLTSGSSFIDRYHEKQLRNEEICRELEALTVGNAEQAQALKRLEKLESRAFETMNAVMQLSEAQDRFSLLQIVGMRTELEGTVKQFMGEVSAFSNMEKRFSRTRQPTAAALWKQRIWQLVIGGFVTSVLVSIFVAMLFARSITARLNLLVKNAERLAEKSPLLPKLPGKDEVAILDSVFHEMARSLEEAAKRERSIVENAVDVIFSLNTANRFIAVNPAASKIWQFAPQELIGESLAKVVVGVVETEEHLERIRSNRHSNSFENTCRQNDGTMISMLWSVDWSDVEQAFFCVAHDITSRKEAEQLLRESEARVRMIVETMPISLLIADENGRIELANSWTEKMFGFNAEYLTEQTVSELLVLNTSASSELDFGAVIKERFEGKLREVQARTASGETLPVEVAAKRFSYQGQEKHLVALLDITERHNIQRLKKEFIAMLAHDLRAPLGAVRLCLSLLMDGAYGSINEAGRSALGKTEGEVERLIQLVNDMLEAERLESGEMKLDREVVAMDMIVMKSIDAVSPLADKAGVHIEPRLSSCETLADGHRLIQVVVNLVANAIKFSPRGSTITVTCHESNSAIEVRVTDQGRGIPVALQAAVFERFRQVERTDATEKGGSGLGLAICKAIVLAHQGEIGVTSEPDKGSTFWFRIPIPEE